MVKIVYKGMRERQEMKANLLLAITLATCVISESYAATDFVVATNLLDSEVHTNAWEDVGLTSLPSYNN